MKPLYCIILALCTVLVCSDMSAQERMFGNGRFLKKLRDDFAKSQKKSDKAKEPTLAKKGKTSGKTRSKTSTPSRKTSSKDKRSTSNSSAKSRNSRNPKVNGFGMVVVQSKNGDLVVSRVDSKGNAAQAGIRTGDKITELGGAELNDASEINTISEILKPGDQMEFTIDSRGKIRKQLIQWGEVPEIDEEVEASARLERNFKANESLRSIVEAPASNFPSSARATNQNSRSLSRIVSEQRRQIQELRRQLQQRSGQQPHLPIVTGPVISGPGK